MKKPLYMESTEIAPERTAAEICQVLVRAGAIQIATDYEEGKIKGLRWSMRAGGRDLTFSMPARIEPVYQILVKRGGDRTKIRAKAERVAWRQLLRWVQAQTAMIETGMVDAAEVFFAYVTELESGRTIYELASASQFRMLGPGKPQ